MQQQATWASVRTSPRVRRLAIAGSWVGLGFTGLTMVLRFALERPDPIGSLAAVLLPVPYVLALLAYRREPGHAIARWAFGVNVGGAVVMLLVVLAVLRSQPPAAIAVALLFGVLGLLPCALNLLALHRARQTTAGGS